MRAKFFEVKRNILLVALAAALPLTASAQVIPLTKDQCYNSCAIAGGEFPTKSATMQHRERLHRIQQQRATETNPEKLKELAQAEAQEMTSRLDDVAKMCSARCRDGRAAVALDKRI